MCSSVYPHLVSLHFSAINVQFPMPVASCAEHDIACQLQLLPCAVSVYVAAADVAGRHLRMYAAMT